QPGGGGTGLGGGGGRLWGPIGSGLVSAPADGTRRRRSDRADRRVDPEPMARRLSVPPPLLAHTGGGRSAGAVGGRLRVRGRRGAISFGMVAIPVRMYLATEAHSAVSFRQLCPHCQLPIKQQRHCPTDDHVVAFNEVLKGYEVAKNQFVLIDEEDLDKLPLKTTRTIDIVEFVERNEVPLGLYIKSAYYLEPDDDG